jgi:hypothetical protein
MYMLGWKGILRSGDCEMNTPESTVEIDLEI